MPRTLVTSALPYANGPIHLGHLIGAYLPADCYVRTLRALGEEALYVCGTDEHGVAITIGAEQEGVPYPEYVARWRAEIKAAFDALGIAFDVWSGTSVCPEHAATSQEFFRRLDLNGFLEKRSEEQLYCEKDAMFLADRYILGTCHECGFEEARGDECPRCGKWLDPLKMPRTLCKVCGTTPVRRRTSHWYLDLPKLRDDGIGAWFEGHPWKPNVRAFIGNQLAEIRPRPITRDMRWGVPVPSDRAAGEQGKVLYVWFDAPIGYVSFTQQWARERGEPEAWKRWWLERDTRLVHFLGKDNIPFHCLVFPSMLFGMKQGWTLPWQVPANEFYNLEGRKFSTSKNWTLPLGPLTQRYEPDVLRFHLLASAPETADSEWRWEEFQRGVNSALADTLGNLTTRVLRFAAKHFEGRVPPLEKSLEAELDRSLLEECGPLADPARSVLDFRFRRAVEELVANGVAANVFIDRHAPWALRAKDPVRAAAVLHTACNWIALLARWMTPFMPRKAQELWTMVGGPGRVEEQPWPGLPRAGAWRTIPAGTPFGEINGPFRKITDEEVAAELEALRARGGETDAKP
jgi:methionyl-tRNA synthetase